MKNKISVPQSIVVSLLTAFLVAACVNGAEKASKASSGNSNGTFQGNMQGFKELLGQLLPLVMDPMKFGAPENRDRIEKEVQKLSEISKQVSHSPTVQYTDPSLRFISSAFVDDIKRVQESMQVGKVDYARYTLMNMTAYCIECHTRTSSGPSFSSVDIEKTLTSLKRIDRGEYLVATRQFDKALKEFKGVITDILENNGNLFELDRAVRYGLAITVKFQKDPKKALELVQLIENSKRTPYYLKQSSKAWSESLKDWSKEKSVKSSGDPEDLLKRCRTIVNKAKQSQNSLADRAGDVYFLRALSDLHQLLSANLKKEQLGEALFLTGLSYEAVRDLGVWSLHENYFESCIRSASHTKWSQNCYQKLEESIYFGFTGSSGIRVPMDIQMKLQELNKLAMPEVQKK